MHRTKIEWTDYAWNPIKGICPVGCWYCYARKIYKRFKLDPTIRPSKEYSEIISMPLFDRKRKIISRRVFVCSTIELFHSSIKETWRDWVFEIIKYNSHLTFQILTKLPQNIDRPMPDNVWLGVTITGERKKQEAFYLGHLGAALTRLRFISIEPFISPMTWIRDFSYIKHFNWIIIGRLTQYGHKYDPKKEWIEQIVKKAKENKIPIFLKNNLKKIWGEPLIQEMPDD